MKKFTPLTLALVLALPSGAAFACASCGCTLNSDFGTQGLSTASGWSLDVRYDTLNQNQLRTGTGTISATDAANVINPTSGDPAEVEKFTNNRYLTTTLDYNNGTSWGVSIAVPYIDRSHSTLGVGGDGINPDPSSGYDSSASGVGDVRVMGRYYGFSVGKNFGIQLGLKLPTGKTNQTSMAADGTTPVDVDPGLQLGTGTTDAIIGAYYFDNLNQNWDYYLQGQFQSALNSSNMAAGSYRPGDSINLTGGLRYHGFESFTPTMQLNVRHVNTDSGDAADTYATGGTLAYFTPGVIVPLTSTLSVYSNLQIPVYQNVNGIQLAPKTIFSIGARVAF
ncbi:TonB-dependent receptor [Rhodoferax sp.]|uniref:TonB-dependent receptor n=1 Tax=Rhodoferax sp. TaxID=50421 RepID=UPI00284182E6|nr:TonB-dependent receptor [Rhodoferax sp.]MDR3368133.1 TonB-dependent receptor [Rhodoferax sp.]